MSTERLTPEIALRWLDEGVPTYDEVRLRFGLFDFMRSPESLDETAVERYLAERQERLRMPENLDAAGAAAMIDALMGESDARDNYIHAIGFAVPTAEAIAAIAAASPRLLEVGAGSGFWSALLARAGVDVVATDKHAGEHGDWHGRYHPTEKLDALAALRAYPDRDVLVCWPTLHGTWARKLAEAIEPGKVLHVIAEECCAEPGFYSVLADRFERLDSQPLPNWKDMRDYLEVMRKLPLEQQRRRKGGRNRRSGQVFVPASDNQEQGELS